MRIPFLLSLPVLLPLLACTGASLQPLPDDSLALGTWGGDNAGLIVTDSTSHVHVGCTFGNSGTVPLDAEGRFTANGSYVLRAYPVMIGPDLPAQFSGQVNGRTLTLAIAVNDTVEKKIVSLGPVTVVFDREPTMQVCPICREPASQAPTSDPSL
jgi:hypothetical protein